MNPIKKLKLWWLNRGTEGFVNWLTSEYGEPCRRGVGTCWHWDVWGTSMGIMVSPKREAYLYNRNTPFKITKLEITDCQESYVSRAIIKSLASIERNRHEA